MQHDELFFACTLKKGIGQLSIKAGVPREVCQANEFNFSLRNSKNAYFTSAQHPFSLSVNSSYQNVIMGMNSVLIIDLLCV